MPYNKPVEEVFKELATGPGGLALEEAEKRLVRYGFNVLEAEEKMNPLRVFYTSSLTPSSIASWRRWKGRRPCEGE